MNDPALHSATPSVPTPATSEQSSRLTLIRVLWTVLAAATILLYASAVPFAFKQYSQVVPSLDITLWQRGLSINIYATYLIALQGITITIFSLTALVIFWSKPDNRITVLISLGLLTFSAIAFPTLEALTTAHPFWHVPVMVIKGLGLISVLLIFYLFPDGRFYPHWTRPLALIWLAWVIAYNLLPASLGIDVENWPVVLQFVWRFLRMDGQRLVTIYSDLRLFSLGAILSFWIGSGVVAQIVRYKHKSDDTHRQQTKWVVLGLSAAAIGYLLVTVLFGPTQDLSPETTGQVIVTLSANTLLCVAYLLVPITMAISILRFRLWDVDFLINQTLVYGALTALVGLFYVGDVILIQALFRAFTGRTSDLAIVLSTLLIATLFQPLRKRLQGFIDRLFFREKIDFRQAFTDFALEIRTIIDLPELLNVLIQRVTRLMHSRHGAVYLYLDDGRFKLAQTTEQLTNAQATQLPVNSASLQKLRSSSAVINPSDPLFPILIPLMAPRAAENQFIGLLALGPRLSGKGYDREDRALLYSLADQAGTAIHVAQLIEEKQAEIQRRETAERSLEEYRNSPVGQAEQFAQQLHQHRRFALVALYKLAHQAGSNPQRASILDNLPQALERLGDETLTSLARAIDYIYASQWTPDLLMVGMRSLTETLRKHQAEFFNGAMIYQIYSLFQTAIEANSIPQIIEAGENHGWSSLLEAETGIDLNPAELADLPEGFIAAEDEELDITGKKATHAIPELVHALRAYERVDTTRDKLAYLASAVERLRHVDHLARTSPNSPDRPVVQQIVESWLAVVTSAMTDLQTQAQIVCQLLTRNTWRNDIITLVLNLRNSGRGSALNITVSLAPAPEYTLINTSETIARLAPGEETQVQLSIRPRLEQGLNQLRARFVLLYTDPRGPDQVDNFADVVNLLATGGAYQFIPNPYVVGTPLQTGSPLFFGRQDVITYIQNNLASLHRNNLVLIGQRRTGKTSLLKQLPKHLSDHYLPVYLDGQSLGLDPGLPNFFHNLATEISFVLEDYSLEIDAPELSDFSENPATHFEKRFLVQVRQAIGDRHLLILLDEFEELEAAIQRGNLDASIFSFLRHIIQHSANLSVIFCGTHRIEELAADYWSILFNISLYRSIGFLEKEDAFHLIQEPVRPYGMQYDDLALDKIWQVTAGHPYFLQLLCHSLVNWHNKTERSYVTISDVNAALDEILASGEAHFVYLWTEAQPLERLVLTALSRMVPLTGHASAVQIVDYLTERGVTVERQGIHEALYRLTLREVLESHEDVEAGLSEYYHWKLGLLGMWVEKYKSMTRVMDEIRIQN
ncbi:MAG: AAA family ATPase [Anaerolineales bacterium]|nr:AAA family ATPase [Anaerolineales bacterium]